MLLPWCMERNSNLLKLLWSYTISGYTQNHSCKVEPNYILNSSNKRQFSKRVQVLCGITNVNNILVTKWTQEVSV